MTTPSPAASLPSGPAAAEAVAGRLSISFTAGSPPADVVAVVEAVNDWFIGHLGRKPDPTPDGSAWLPWPLRWVEGCNMLAGRIYNRRNSPAGVATFGAEGAVYVSRNDPDVAMLLGIGSYTRPQVG